MHRSSAQRRDWLLLADLLWSCQKLHYEYWGKKVGGLPGRRVGALKAAKGDEGDFGLESFEVRDSPDKALSNPDVADELWREDESL